LLLLCLAAVAGAQTWMKLHPQFEPSGRSGHVMAYDATRNLTVLFSGASSSIVNDTSVWDGSNWTQKSPATNPLARVASVMAYDSTRKQVVMFGGYSGGFLGDTWVWDVSDHLRA
jgi:hypothetical protein